MRAFVDPVSPHPPRACGAPPGCSPDPHPHPHNPPIPFSFYRAKRRTSGRVLRRGQRRDDRTVCPSSPAARIAPRGPPLARSASRGSCGVLRGGCRRSAQPSGFALSSRPLRAPAAARDARPSGALTHHLTIPRGPRNEALRVLEPADSGFSRNLGSTRGQDRPDHRGEGEGDPRGLRTIGRLGRRYPHFAPVILSGASRLGAKHEAGRGVEGPLRESQHPCLVGAAMGEEVPRLVAALQAAPRSG
jgi:hypothetical protein